MLLFLSVLLMIGVLAILTLPLRRVSPGSLALDPEALKEQERTDLEIERQNLVQSLAELELDLAQGKFRQEDYERLKAIDERRLLKTLGRLDGLERESKPAAGRRPAARPKRPEPLHWAGSLALSAVVIGSAAGIFYYLEWRQQPGRAVPEEASPGGPGAPDPLEMVARLEERLKANPNDLEGQVMAGRSYMTLRRVDDARKAWTKVLELDPRNQEGNFYMGLLLIETAPKDDARTFERALNHLDIALVREPQAPVLLWYRGVALVRLKRFREADESWTTAYQNLEPGSEDAEFVKEQLQKLRDGKPLLF